MQVMHLVKLQLYGPVQIVMRKVPWFMNNVRSSKVKTHYKVLRVNICIGTVNGIYAHNTLEVQFYRHMKSFV
jgi:hypothetical protein